MPAPLYENAFGPHHPPTCRRGEPLARHHDRADHHGRGRLRPFHRRRFSRRYGNGRDSGQSYGWELPLCEHRRSGQPAKSTKGERSKCGPIHPTPEIIPTTTGPTITSWWVLLGLCRGFGHASFMSAAIQCSAPTIRWSSLPRTFQARVPQWFQIIFSEATEQLVTPP